MLKTYMQKLQIIQNCVEKMSKDILNALQNSANALQNKDLSILENANISQKILLSQSNEIDNLIVMTIALNSPEARDLRKLIAFLKVTSLLVNIGANVRDFAKLCKKNYENLEFILEHVKSLQNSTYEAFANAINMLDEEDTQNKYKKVLLEEVKTDNLYLTIQKDILKIITENSHFSKDYIKILSALRKLEKIADKSVQIANLLKFAYIGGKI